MHRRHAQSVYDASLLEYNSIYESLSTAMLYSGLLLRLFFQELNLFPNPKLTYFAFKSYKIKYYPKDLNPYASFDPHNNFTLFLNKMVIF